MILPNLISEEQAAFVHQRSMINNILLAQKVMHLMVRTPEPHSLMMLKFDTEKAR